MLSGIIYTIKSSRTYSLESIFCAIKIILFSKNELSIGSFLLLGQRREVILLKCIFCKEEMKEAGFFDFTCLNHPKNERVKASKVNNGMIFTRTNEEAVLVRKDGTRESIPLSKAVIAGADVTPISDEMRKIVCSLSRKELKSIKRHAIVVVF